MQQKQSLIRLTSASTAICIFYFVASFCIVSISYAGEFNSSIVRIQTTSNNYSYRSPWLSPQQYDKMGTGFIIDKNRIITNAHVISDNVYIEVRRADDIRPYEAQVLLVDHDCDLAMLKIVDENFMEGAAPLEIGKTLKIGQNVSVYGFPIGGDEVSLTKGVVSRIEMNEYAHSGKQLLLAQVDAAINPGNSGGPVIIDSKVVGVATQGYNFGQNIGYMIPLQVLKHFLDGYTHDGYKGFPNLPVRVQMMENPAIQEKFSMHKNHSGVLINKIDYKSQNVKPLKVDDIILSINNNKISNNGTILIDDNLRVRADYLITKAFVGDKLKFNILRDGKELSVEVSLPKKTDIPSLVPDIAYGRKPAYYIFGGIVFQPLTANYLHSFSTEKAGYPPPPALTYYYVNGEVTKDRDEVVVLNKVLPDDSNKGYQSIRDAVVAKLNGTRVKNMSHLQKIILNNRDKYLVLETEDKGRIVLNYQYSNSRDNSINLRYNIASNIRH